MNHTRKKSSWLTKIIRQSLVMNCTSNLTFESSSSVYSDSHLSYIGELGVTSTNSPHHPAATQPSIYIPTTTHPLNNSSSRTGQAFCLLSDWCFHLGWPWTHSTSRETFPAFQSDWFPRVTLPSITVTSKLHQQHHKWQFLQLAKQPLRELDSLHVL